MHGVNEILNFVEFTHIDNLYDVSNIIVIIILYLSNAP